MKKCQNIELTGKKRLENQNGHGRWSRDLRKAEMAKDKNEWRCHMNAEQEHLCRRVVYKMQGWLFAMANKNFCQDSGKFAKTGSKHIVLELLKPPQLYYHPPPSCPLKKANDFVSLK